MQHVGGAGATGTRDPSHLPRPAAPRDWGVDAVRLVEHGRAAESAAAPREETPQKNEPGCAGGSALACPILHRLGGINGRKLDARQRGIAREQRATLLPERRGMPFGSRAVPTVLSSSRIHHRGLLAVAGTSAEDRGRTSRELQHAAERITRCASDVMECGGLQIRECKRIIALSRRFRHVAEKRVGASLRRRLRYPPNVATVSSVSLSGSNSP